MNLHKLDYDETIVLQAKKVTREGFDESEFEEEELQELILTNKHLIYVASDIDNEDENERIILVPLSSVKVINGEVQVKEIKHELYGQCLEVQLKHGIEYWKFGRKSKQLIPQWIDEMSRIILETLDNNVSVVKQQEEMDDITLKCEEKGMVLKKKKCFCVSCGAEIYSGSKYCHECGTSVDIKKTKNLNKETVYEGKLHKCPNCGEVVKAFELNCSACGYEFRDVTATMSVRVFAEKMEKLQKNGRRTDKNNIISHIRTFPIPNTKGDLFEFMVLAGSNIRGDRYDKNLAKHKQEISDAWKAKFEQAYHKSKIVLKGDDMLDEVEEMYQKKMDMQRVAEKKGRIARLLSFDDMYMIHFIIFTFITCGGFLLSQQIAVKSEINRLNTIVEEVYDSIEAENYMRARTKASTLVFTKSILVNDEENSQKWEKTRSELLAIIDKAEKDTINVIPSDQK